MKRLPVLILTLLIVVVSPALHGETVYELIMQGRIQEASDSLARMTTAALRDGDVLFFQSLIEPDAGKSAQLMETALKSSVSLTYRQEVYYRLAQYYLINEDYRNLSRIVNEYRARWETGKYEEQMMRFSVIVDQMTGNYESALRQADRFLVRYGTSETSQWGTVDKARILWANDKRIGAVKMLKELSREKKGVGVPQALYLLAIDAVERKNTEDAVFYYNLFRDAYPDAIGLDVLVERMSSMANSYGTDDNTAEKLTGTYYAVQVGVFSVKQNAQQQADRFKKDSPHVVIRDKTVSGKKYSAVYVGKFQSYAEAYNFKRALESKYGEVFQVVAR